MKYLLSDAVVLLRGKLAKSIYLFQSKYNSWYYGIMLYSNYITGVMQAYVCPPSRP